MKLNADFKQRIVIKPDDYNWTPSPSNGVKRMMLDRIGDEIARATSIVQYKPNSQFPAHTHRGGEEFFVLDGTFSDEYGDYPAGHYVRNPIGTRHNPKIGSEGALIYVKLHQFDPNDKERKVIDTQQAPWKSGFVNPDISSLTLHHYKTEFVSILTWPPHTSFNALQHWGGKEVFVLKGQFSDEYGHYPMGSWLRIPHFQKHHPYTNDHGATLLIKTGHLPTY